MKTFKHFREGFKEDEKEAYSEETCSECGCNPKSPKKDCDCQHKAVEEGAYGKKKMKEEVEEIEEVSKNTLGSYIKKATASYGTRSRIGKDFERDSEQARSAKTRKASSDLAKEYAVGAQKRKDGIGKATDRLVNKKKDD